MAYQFNAINSQIDQKPKTNIFDPSSGQSGQQQGGQSDVFQTANTGGASAPSAGGSSGVQPKTNTPGSGSGGMVTAAAKQQAWGSIAGPDASKQTGKISADIAGANQKLQEQANAYQGKAANEAAGYGLDEITLQGAAAGNDKDYSTTAQRLAKTQATPFEQFGGLESKDLPSSAEALRYPGNFGEVFRPSATGDYTAGESSLNSLLLKRSPGFKQTAAQLVGDQDAAIKASDTAKETETKKAQDMLNAKYATETQAIRDRLGAFGKEVMTDAEAKEAYIEAERRGLDPSKLSQEQFATLAAELKGLYGNSDPKSEQARMLEYLKDPSGFDLSKYGKVNTDVNAEDLIDQEGADKFNRINALLGNSSKVLSKGKGMGDAFSFDKAGAASDLYNQLLGRRQEEDRGLKTKIQQIEDEAKKAAASAQIPSSEGYLNPDAMAAGDAYSYLDKTYMQQNEGQSDLMLQAEKEALRRALMAGTNNPDQAFTRPKQPTWQDMLSADQAKNLTDYSQNLGIGGSYAAGGGVGGTFNQGFYDNTFKAEYEKILAQLAAGNTSYLGGINNPNPTTQR